MYYIAYFDESSQEWRKQPVILGTLFPYIYESLGSIGGITDEHIQYATYFESFNQAVYHFIGHTENFSNKKYELRKVSFDPNIPDSIPEDLQSKIEQIKSFKDNKNG